MSESTDLELYLQLALASELRRQPMDRDKLLVLAGVAAADLGLEDIAARCRRKILEHNSGHLVRGFPSLATACGQERFDVYLRKLRREFPREKAEHMLRSLVVESEHRRPADQSTHDYAAALLESMPEQPQAGAAAVEPPRAATPATRPTNWRTVGLLAAALLALVALTAWLFFR